MLEAIRTTTLSRRAWALSRSAITSRKRRSSNLGAPIEIGMGFQSPPPGLAANLSLRKAWVAAYSVLTAVQAEQGMQSPHRKLGIGSIDQYADFDLRGRNRLDIDAFFGKGAEHLGGNAGVAAHADADGRDLGDVRGAAQIGITDGLPRLLKPLDGAVEIGALQR